MVLAAISLLVLEMPFFFSGVHVAVFVKTSLVWFGTRIVLVHVLLSLIAIPCDE